MDNNRNIRIFLADDHHIFRQGIRALLSDVPDFKIVGEAENGREILEKLEKADADVVLMDIKMPDVNGLEAMPLLRGKYPEIKVLVFSMYDDEEYIQKMLRKGANGYVLKTVRKDDLVRAIRTLAEGDSYLCREVSRKLFSSLREANLGKKSKSISDIPLTPREVEVVKLVAAGNTNQNIGEELSISSRTVDTHRRNIMEKLNLHNAAALVNYASKHGLLD